jgi:ribosomal protein S18 acetylase RimI-like enzyme
MQAVVRRAESADVSAIVALYLEVEDEVVAREPTFRHAPDAAAVEARYLPRIDESDRLVMVADVDDVVVGFVDAILRRHLDAGTYHAPGIDAYVEELIVTSRHRRRGVGRALIQGVEARARDAGARMVVLDTHVTNTIARALYASMAYREFGVILVKEL